ncbi:MAG: BatD family protein [Planctomycetes bacterium]|nr:BatD family protein [Planctomycetota bacterium]
MSTTLCVALRRGIVAALLVVLPLVAQERLQVTGPQPALMRLGDVATVNIVIEGEQADPRPFSLPAVDGLRLVGVEGPMRSSQFVFDGRRSAQSVTVSYQVTVQPQREGVFVIPPFLIWTGTRQQQTPELRLEARRDREGAELGWVEVAAVPQRVYVHEPVRLDIDFGVLAGLRLLTLSTNTGQPVFDVEVTADWLDQVPFGEPIEVPTPRNGQQLIVHDRRPLSVDYANDHERAGQRWQRFTMHRAFLPTRPGTFELAAPSLRFQVVRREGQRRGALSENLFVQGQPLRIEVLPLPEAGRPDPYYRAVGRGMTIEARLDHDRVKLGGSLKLTLTVRGQGNLEFLEMPNVDALPLLHKLGEAQVQRSADKVVVTYDLTPRTGDVKQVPAIGWNYFDTTPGVERYVSLATSPLPLTVLPLERTETLAPLPDAAAKPITPGVDDVFDLPAFDGEPLRATTLPRWAGVLVVFGPWLLALGGLLAFRRWRVRAADVNGQRVRAALRTCRQALDRGDDALDALAGYVADRLAVPAAAVISPDLRQRLVSSGLDAELAEQVVCAIEQGTAARYGAGEPLAATTVRDLTARLEGQRAWAPSWLLLLLLPALLATGPLGAQTAPDPLAASSPATATAIAAYRAGDYERAAADFAALFARTGDRRFLMARGNCEFRRGDLPRALWAYESARLALPRDHDLLANLSLVRRQLQIPEEASGFVAELVTLRSRLSPFERLWCCAFGMSLSALCLVLGWRRVGRRWIGVLVLVPTLGLAVDVLGFVAAPRRAVALQRVELVSEPRTGLPPLAAVAPGVVLEVLGGGQGAYLRVAAGDRRGYVSRDRMAIIE